MLISLAFGLLYATNSVAGECDKVLGEKMFQKCVVCHSSEEGAGHSVGPNLHGLIDRPIGKVEGFKFSRALRKSEGSWTVEALDAFLQSPMEVYPRTSMAFAGLKKENDRQAVICYLSAE